MTSDEQPGGGGDDGDEATPLADLQAQVTALKSEVADLRYVIERRLGVVDDRSLMNAERIVGTHSSLQSVNERLIAVNALVRRAAKTASTPPKGGSDASDSKPNPEANARKNPS